MLDHHSRHLPVPKLGLRARELSVFLMVLAALAAGSLGCASSEHEAEDNPNASMTLRNFQTAEAADKLSGYTPLVAIVKKGKVSGYYASEDAAKQALVKESVKSINKSQILDAKRTRIPLKRAMELIISERAKPMPKPEPLVTVDASDEAPVALAPPPSLEIKPELVTQGKAAFAVCGACHSIDGSKLVGPSMKGLWGKVENLADGTKVRVNEEYFIRSIKEPTAQIVEGYPPAMAQLPMTDVQIEALMHYVASLK